MSDDFDKLPQAQIDETAASMARVMNDEQWADMNEVRRSLWRDLAKEMGRAMMLPQGAARTTAIKLVEDRIKREAW